MSLTETETEALNQLQNAYDQEGGTEALNVPIRELLKRYARGEDMKYLQDSAGNIYISRQGRDSELADIAIGFPLDGQKSPAAFKSAFTTFAQLGNAGLVCGVTLMGYTSIVGVDGFQLWEASSSPSENALTLLPQFSKDSSPADFPFSAFFEVVETEEDILTLQGSPVLTAKAQKCALGSNNAKISRKDTPRAPYLSVRGTTAKRVARETVCDYSSYIAKLFENFD